MAHSWGVLMVSPYSTPWEYEGGNMVLLRPAVALFEHFCVPRPDSFIRHVADSRHYTTHHPRTCSLVPHAVGPVSHCISFRLVHTAPHTFELRRAFRPAATLVLHGWQAGLRPRGMPQGRDGRCGYKKRSDVWDMLYCYRVQLCHMLNKGVGRLDVQMIK
jgi:hypothetical protein